MRNKLFYTGLLLLSLCLLPAAAAPQEDILTKLEQEINSSLDRLSNQSKSLEEELTTLQNLVPELQTKSKELEASLELTQKQLNSCAMSLENYKSKLKDKEARLRRLTIVLIIAGIMAIAARAVILYLKAKGIEIPFIINTLL